MNRALDERQRRQRYEREQDDEENRKNLDIQRARDIQQQQWRQKKQAETAHREKIFEQISKDQQAKQREKE